MEGSDSDDEIDSSEDNGDDTVQDDVTTNNDDLHGFLSMVGSSLKD